VKSLEKTASEAAARLVTLTAEHEKEKQLLVKRAEETEGTEALDPIRTLKKLKELKHWIPSEL
jgi:hypothetical protein